MKSPGQYATGQNVPGQNATGKSKRYYKMPQTSGLISR